MFTNTGVSLLGAQPSGGGGGGVYQTGLKAHWDAGNAASYPGTGTTMFDLSGNGNDGTLKNGATYNASLNGGAIQTFGGGDSIQNLNNFMNGTKDWTIQVISQYKTFLNFRRLWGGIMAGDSGDCGYASPTQVRVLGSGGGQGFWTTFGVGSFVQNAITMYTYQCNNVPNPSSRRWYTNLNNISFNGENAQDQGSQNAAVLGVTWCGNVRGGEGQAADNYVLLMYEGALGINEITQNYNFYQAKYNLP